MKLSEQSKEDITDDVIESRDVEEDDLTTAYLKGYADAEEKYRKRIKELEEENRIFALEGSRVKLKLHIEKNYIPKQKIKNRIKENKKLIDETYSEDIIQKSADENEILEELLEDK